MNAIGGILLLAMVLGALFLIVGVAKKIATRLFVGAIVIAVGLPALLVVLRELNQEIASHPGELLCVGVFVIGVVVLLGIIRFARWYGNTRPQKGTSRSYRVDRD